MRPVSGPSLERLRVLLVRHYLELRAVVELPRSLDAYLILLRISRSDDGRRYPLVQLRNHNLARSFLELRHDDPSMRRYAHVHLVHRIGTTQPRAIPEDMRDILKHPRSRLPRPVASLKQTNRRGRGEELRLLPVRVERSDPPLRRLGHRIEQRTHICVVHILHYRTYNFPIELHGRTSFDEIVSYCAAIELAP